MIYLAAACGFIAALCLCHLWYRRARVIAEFTMRLGAAPQGHVVLVMDSDHYVLTAGEAFLLENSLCDLRTKRFKELSFEDDKEDAA
jgi:hypothetical protein